MSFNRNKAQDRFNTRQILKNPSEAFGEKNWLDHSGAAAKIDQMILEGATFERILTSGRKPNAARSHLNHLKAEHGLPIDIINGVYRFAFASETKPEGPAVQADKPLFFEPSPKAETIQSARKLEVNHSLEKIREPPEALRKPLPKMTLLNNSLKKPNRSLKMKFKEIPPPICIASSR